MTLKELKTKLEKISSEYDNNPVEIIYEDVDGDIMRTNVPEPEVIPVKGTIVFNIVED